MGLDLWLNSLKSCGVGLYEYGKREEELQAIRNKFNLICRIGRTAKLASFTYGSSPGEWDFKVEWKFLDRDLASSRDSDQDSGQVEEMPGGWVED